MSRPFETAGHPWDCIHDYAGCGCPGTDWTNPNPDPVEATHAARRTLTPHPELRGHRFAAVKDRPPTLLPARGAREGEAAGAPHRPPSPCAGRPLNPPSDPPEAA